MDAITRAINEAIATKLWLPALALALAVPDICSQIEYPELAGPGSTGKRYPLWFDAWVKERLFRFGHAGKEFPMAGEDCYAFRNAFLHVGESELQRKHKANYTLLPRGTWGTCQLRKLLANPLSFTLVPSRFAWP